jgi:hypothetical protein
MGTFICFVRFTSVISICKRITSDFFRKQKGTIIQPAEQSSKRKIIYHSLDQLELKLKLRIGKVLDIHHGRGSFKSCRRYSSFYFNKVNYFLYISLSFLLPVCLLYLCACLPACLSACLSACLPACLSACCLPVCLFVTVCLCLSVSLPACLSACLPDCLFACLSA